MMEIRSNTPHAKTSFGMAFIKPSEDSLNHLTEYLTKNAPIADVTSGLSRIIVEQAENNHFNIEYNSAKNSFKVFPVSQEAKKFVQGQTKIFEPDTKYISKLETLKKNIKTDSAVLKNNGMSKFEIFRFKAGCAIKLSFEQLRRWLNPKLVLPQNLQQSAEYATEMGNKIERDIYNKQMIKDLFKESSKK